MDVLTTEHKNLGSNPTINDRAVTHISRVFRVIRKNQIFNI